LQRGKISRYSKKTAGPVAIFLLRRNFFVAHPAYQQKEKDIGAINQPAPYFSSTQRSLDGRRNRSDEAITLPIPRPFKRKINKIRDKSSHPESSFLSGSDGAGIADRIGKHPKRKFGHRKSGDVDLLGPC